MGRYVGPLLGVGLAIAAVLTAQFTAAAAAWAWWVRDVRRSR